MKKRVFCAVLVLLLILSMPCFAEQLDAVPEVTARNVVLVNTNTGATAYSLNPDEKVYPASVTKLMTLIVALEHIDDMEAIVTVDESCYDDLVVGSSNMALKDGEQLRVIDLLYGIALSSANEAANAIAQYLCGDAPAFVELMNQKAAELGANNTHFVNTHGLQDENHYTTASDMAIIAAAAFSNPTIRELTSTVSYVIEPTNETLSRRTLVTTNSLLNSNSQSYYRYAICGKTGSTTAAGYNLVSLAKKGDVEFLLVAMNVERISGVGNTVFDDSKKLYQWAFDNYTYTRIINEQDLITEVKVELSAKGDHLVLTPAKSLSQVVPNDLDVSQLERKITTEPVIYAPVKKGDVLGSLVLEKDGVVYGEVDLVSNSDVSRSTVLYYLHLIKMFFSNIWVRIICIILAVLIVIYIIIMINNNRRRKRRRLRRRIKF
jgi:hypothetical protein